MSDFADLIASAVNPSMTRDEREKVYGVVRKAVHGMLENEHHAADDPHVVLQLHLVEETIRDIEFDVVRHNAMERMRLSSEAQDAESESIAARTR